MRRINCFPQTDRELALEVVLFIHFMHSHGLVLRTAFSRWEINNLVYHDIH